MTIKIMLDFETMGNGLRPAIVEIGAIAFDNRFSTIDDFSCGVTLVSSIMHALEITDSTLEWWIGQEDDAKKSLLSSQENAITLDTALYSFMDWIDKVREMDEGGDIELWGNGMISDNVWLYSACHAVGIDLQKHVQYTEHKCYRQEMARALDWYGFNPHWEIKKEGVLHNAIDDCQNQIKALKVLARLDQTDDEFIKEEIDLIKEEYC